MEIDVVAVRDVVMGRWSLVAERRKVRSGRLADPYDTYAFFNEVHSDDPLRWFVLASIDACPLTWDWILTERCRRRLFPT